MTAVFIHIPKTGGMSISKALDVQKYRNRRRLRRDGKYSGIVTFGHELLPWLQRRGLAPTDAFFFAFCRNPYDRVVSLWSYYREQYVPDITFSEFCLNIGRYGWRIRYPQAKWLDGMQLDFLGRYENLQGDFETLCGLLGVERKKALPHLNRSEHEPYTNYYDDVTRAIVQAHYARDFETFGYAVDYLPDR